MSDAWFAAFALLGLLSLANSVVLIAVLRQVGVLHQRIRPTGAGQHEGPQPDDVLPDVPLIPINDAPRASEAVVEVIGYVTSDCGLCDAAVRAFSAYARTRPPGVELALVTDGSEQDAKAMLHRHDVRMPFFVSRDVRANYGLPGSPYVLVLVPAAPGARRVLTSGVVNTLEQLEDLVDDAYARLDDDGRPDVPLEISRVDQEVVT
jgi:hypothetical protein